MEPRILAFEGMGVIVTQGGEQHHPVSFVLHLADDADVELADEAAKTLSMFIMQTKAQVDAMMGGGN